MTLDDACLYLGISPDAEELDLNELQENYARKIKIYDKSRFTEGTAEYIKAEKMRGLIDEAFDYMLEVYAELYGDQDEEEPEIVPEIMNRDNTKLLIKIALSVSTITFIIIAMFIFFVINDKYNNTPEKIYDNNTDYEIVMQEIEQLKIKTLKQESNTPGNTGITDYADLAEKVMPSIVRINTDRSTGSGFFANSDGDILTNFHVIEFAGNITVITEDGRNFRARVKKFDSDKDIALLSVNMRYPAPFLRISSKLPRQGEAVMAVGNPRGLNGTVSNGIISAFRGNNNEWVQFTAPVSPGSSGGALINAAGEVVGMPTMLLEDSQNLNFAISSGVLLRFLNSAKQ